MVKVKKKVRRNIYPKIVSGLSSSHFGFSTKNSYLLNDKCYIVKICILLSDIKTLFEKNDQPIFLHISKRRLFKMFNSPPLMLMFKPLISQKIL